MIRRDFMLKWKMVAVIGTFLILAACNFTDDRKTLTGKLDSYYMFNGKQLEYLVSWLDDSLGVDSTSYYMESRSRGAEVSFCKFDSNGLRSGFFTPEEKVPRQIMKFWGHAMISSVTKDKRFGYYQVIVGDFTNTGHDIRIIITAPGHQLSQADFRNYHQLVANADSIDCHVSWLYKKSDRFWYLGIGVPEDAYR